MLSFDEFTGVRTGPLRNFLIKKLLPDDTQPTCHTLRDSLVQVFHLHEVGLGVCSFGPGVELDFGYVRPLHFQIVDHSPAARGNWICTDPFFLLEMPGHITAEQFDIWCIGVTVAVAFGFPFFTEAQRLAPLEALANLRELYKGALFRDEVKKFAQILPSPFDQVTQQCLITEPSQRATSAQVYRTLSSRKLQVRESLDIQAGVNGLTASEALDLLRIKLDLSVHVFDSDKQAARMLATTDSNTLLQEERALVDSIGKQ